MLLGFNSVSFTTTEARAQAGGGGGDRAVTITATSDTPGITVTGPIEEGFDEGVSAFIVEFTPTVLDDEPPEHASVAITIAPQEGWTLQQPNPGNMPIVRNTPLGEFADDIEWQATRIVQGVPEDTATGTIRVAWPWAEFEIGELKTTSFPGTCAHTAWGTFTKEIGIDLDVVVTIRVIPSNLPVALRNEEARKWSAGWVQNLLSLGRTCWYPHKIQVVWWETSTKPDMPIFDSTAAAGEEAFPLWYSAPAPFVGDGSFDGVFLRDFPGIRWDWHQPPMNESDWPASRATYAVQLDQFRAWLVAARGKDDALVIEWLNWLNWSTDLRVQLVSDPNVNHQWNGMGFHIEEEVVSAGQLQEGQGDTQPDIEPDNMNQLFKRITNNR